MIIPTIPALVGESLPIRFSFLTLLKSFSAQTLTGASITWTSVTPAIATFDGGSAALVSSDEGIAEGFPNDACLGRFTMVSAGQCTVYVTVDAINPVATYVGQIVLNVEAINTP